MYSSAVISALFAKPGITLGDNPLEIMTDANLFFAEDTAHYLFLRLYVGLTAMEVP